MKEYMICFLFWGCFIVLLYCLGRALFPQKNHRSESLLLGYLGYSAAVSAGGIVIQFLNLKWMYFEIYMVLVWCVILGYIVYRVKKKKVRLFQGTLADLLKENWVAILVCVILTALLLLYYNAYWYGNHLDDGYYITKIATMPYNATGFRTNYSVGVGKSGIDSYVLNTWELEASVYVKLLGVSVTLFLRLFQSAFHIFLMVNCVLVFAYRIFEVIDRRLEKKEIQIPCVILILFGTYYLFLQDTNLFFLRDAWQFNSGMFLGSSVVRMLGIFLLLFEYIGAEKITKETVLGVMLISFVLITKSSTALPLIVIVAYAYLSTWLIVMGQKKMIKAAGALLIVLWGITSVIVPNSINQQTEVFLYGRIALRSPVFIVCTIIFIASFWLKNRAVNQLNATVILMIAMMMVPQFNDIFEQLSMYAFVAGRTWTVLGYTYIALNSIYLYIMLRKVVKMKWAVQGAYGVMAAASTAVAVISFQMYGGELFLTEEPPVKADLKANLNVIYNNHYFVPNSSILLGQDLETLQEENGEQLYVVCPELVAIDGAAHSLASQIRIFAPDIISVSAVNRYSVDEDCVLYGYEQSVYDEFVCSPGDASAEKFAEAVKKYGINCVLTINADCENYLEEMGFECYKQAGDNIYYIWYRQ